jgi:outer membrane protein assembly factor BamA
MIKLGNYADSHRNSRIPNLKTANCIILCGIRMSYFLRLLLLLVFVPGMLCYGQDGGVQKLTIKRVEIEGNKVTRSRVILRELSAHEGDVVASDSVAALVEENRLRLFNLQLFNEVEQRTEVKGDELYWYIKVKERWYIIPTVTVQFADRNFNTWWVKQNHDLRRITAGLTVTDKNFRGNLEQLAVTVQGGYTQGLGISYMRPYVNRGQTRGFGFFANVSQSTQTYYATDFNKLVYAGGYTGPVMQRQVTGGISYFLRPAYASKHTFTLSYADYAVNDTIIKLNPEYYTNKSRTARFAELYYRYEYNGVDNWNYSLDGFKLVSKAVARKGFEGLDFQAYLNVEAGYFCELLPKWYVAGIFRGRLMYPTDQPYYFKGGLGTTTDYVRGYEYYVIDGDNYGVLRLDLKRELFNHTWSSPMKYFTAIPLRIYPKIFADAGYVNGINAGNNFLSSTFLYSVGVGLDVVTLYDIKIRFEVAWNHLSQNGLYLHFNSE